MSADVAPDRVVTDESPAAPSFDRPPFLVKARRSARDSWECFGFQQRGGADLWAELLRGDGYEAYVEER